MEWLCSVERVIDYNGTLWDRHKQLKGVTAVIADNLLGSVPAYRLVLHAFTVVIYCSVGVFNVIFKIEQYYNWTFNVFIYF